MKTYAVVYERDESGWWVATIKKVRGCHTQGRTVEQARKRIREALGLFVDNVESIKLIDDIKLPHRAKILLKHVYENRERAQQEATKLQSSTIAAAKLLTKDLGVSVRDAGELLRLSHQRIHQLISSSAR